MISCSYNAARPFTPTFDNDTLGPHQPYFSAFSLFQFIFAGETRRGARGGEKNKKKRLKSNLLVGLIKAQKALWNTSLLNH